ncbi:hypothetical protein CORC01_09737 [Colletotrichum orchidophilum]|uniref:Transcription factor domain-containing protein n=1 Tax=Colletotrichum orchidophilum TaxID=1209926 RepID=A0A1G4B0S6_9PEZI|nr:uncharacterized protein CORC01_09737 [Colletotrichum orchidophilum]OHE94943.1 hypothetical protein CORC01_09737 [Colletotrichum orchidophilum]
MKTPTSNHAVAASKGFAFVITDTSGKPKSDDRKLIRSHVMRGKNTRASHSGPKRPTTWVNQSSPDPPQETEQFAPRSLSTIIKEPRKARLYSEAWVEHVFRTPNDLYMFQFADDIDAASRGMLFEFYAIIKETMYPIEWCLQYDESKTPWFYWLLTDAAFLHSILFTVGLLHDSVKGESASKKTNFHVWKTLHLLNKNIANQNMALADSTIATIVSMCMVAEIFGQRDSAAAHIKGMRQIVKLRGGIESFSHNLQLQVKICRVDIGWSLCTGDTPLYFQNSFSWEPAFSPILGKLPVGSEICPGSSHILLLLDASDSRLGNVFQDLHDFSRLATALYQTNRKIDPNLFQQFMTCVQYRLLYLEATTQNPLADLGRLGMISYITTLFLQVQGAKISFTSLASNLRSACQNFEVLASTCSTTRLLLAWTLVVGAISVLEEEDDSWLLPKLANLRDSLGPTWPEAKAKLEEVIWTENIHDSAGIKVFEKLVLYVAKVPRNSN